MPSVASLPLGQRRVLDSWCRGPRLVVVRISPARPPAVPVADETGSLLHLEWEGVLQDKTPNIHDRMERVQELTGPQVTKWRSGPGTFCIRTAAKLFLVGGTGNWEVDAFSAPDINGEARSTFELQRFVNTRATGSHVWIPPGHTHIELLAGWLLVNGIFIPPRSPISINEAQFFGWQANGLIRTYLEV